MDLTGRKVKINLEAFEGRKFSKIFTKFLSECSGHTYVVNESTKLPGGMWAYFLINDPDEKDLTEESPDKYVFMENEIILIEE